MSEPQIHMTEAPMLHAFWAQVSGATAMFAEAGKQLGQRLEALALRIRRIEVCREDHLRLDLLSEVALDGDLIVDLQDGLRAILQIREVEVYLSFEASEDDSQLACRLLPWFADHYRRHGNGLIAAMLSSLACRSEAGRMLLQCPPAVRSAFTGEFIEGAMRFFDERAGLDAAMAFDLLEDEAQQQEGIRSWLDQISQLQQATQARMDTWTEEGALRSADLAGSQADPNLLRELEDSKPSKPEKRTYRGKRSEQHLWGRAYPELTPQPIKSFHNETGLVKFTGCLTLWETRLIAEGTRSLAKFSIHETQGAINCTAFLSNEDAEALSETLDKKDGVWVTAVGEVTFDGRYAHDLVCKVLGLEQAEPPEPRMDRALEKRVELHCHSKKSASDAMADVEKLIGTAARFGHPAIAITDHGVVQAYPEAYEALQDLKKKGKASPDMKLIYGMEGYLVDDGPSCVFGVDPQPLGDRFVALDLETTGLDPAEGRIIEAAAVRFVKGPDGYFWPEDRFEALIAHDGPLPETTVKITGITDELLAREGRPMDEVMAELHAFIEGETVVGHNVFFDLGFLRYEGFRTPEPTDPRMKFNPQVIDTLELSRALLPDLRSHRLGDVAAHLGVRLDQAHRAMGDTLACGQVFAKLWAQAEVETLEELQTKIGHQPKSDYINVKRKPWHIIFLVTDELGLYHLYRLVSESHINYFKGRPRIPRSVLNYFRQGLILGAACEAGEVLRAIRTVYEEVGGDYAQALERMSSPEMKKIGRYYDYLEIQPETNNSFMMRAEHSVIRTPEDVLNLNRLVLALGEIVDRPVAATCDAHFIDPEDGIYRRMLLTSMNFADAEETSDLYFRTTDEMLDSFRWMGPEAAHRAVIEVPNQIAARVKPDMRPFPAGTFPPIIASAATDVRQMTVERAMELYGHKGELPEIVRERMERELSSIIDNGFAIMYYIASKLVKDTYANGQVVGSRGSVGSSLVATFCGITEVNPLPPHHYCPSCRYSKFDASGDFGSGYDLPPMDCPECGTAMIREGQDIPFETFLGFHGDKQPDIDLNFSGEYQANAHAFITDMFGEEHTFRAGTITSFKEKNAMGVVLKYLEANNAFATEAEKVRLASGLVDVKRSTGQHPGGIVVVPKEREIYDFTPLQYPADKQDAAMRTTHFDFNSLHDTILKLDILGHDDPTMQVVLSEMTGVKIEDIPIPDPKVMSLFESNEALNLQYETGTDAATLGLPELGTHMARDMVKETRPTRFYDLVQLMGLSHGTDVWKGNAQDLIRAGTHTINDVIGCRDSIMTSLIRYGLPSKLSFDIMEKVRKGKGLTPEWEAAMREHQVPEWYIESCQKIKYMFPKAHAAAYIISSLRVAWFKVYKPAYYYAAYFAVRADLFDIADMGRPVTEITASRERIGREFMRSKDRDQKLYYIYELVEEMHARGIHFAQTDVMLSEARRFVVLDDSTIRPALNTVPGVSTAIAEQIVAAREANDGSFISQDELQAQSGVGPSVIESLREHGCMGDLPESSQMTLFEMM